MDLRSRLGIRLLLGVPCIAAVLFCPAGSLKFWQGWLFLATFLAGNLALTYYLYRHDPRLLERRLLSKETGREQKLFRMIWIPLWVGGLMLPGLDHRFGWSRVPAWLTLFATALVMCAYYLLFVVMRANSFASSVIQVEAGQRVISDGPYRIVRHPMYSTFLVLIVAVPLALGSYVSLPVFALLIPLLIFRLVHEETMLRKELPCYAEYCRRTRFRLVPFIF